MKKATLYAKGFHTRQVILTFSIIYSISLQAEKKFHSLRTQFAVDLA